MILNPNLLILFGLIIFDNITLKQPRQNEIFTLTYDAELQITE